MTISVAVAGSTARTAQCVQALQDDPNFVISWILTPEPKPIGRKQTLTQNPLHQLAQQQQLQTYLIQQKITKDLLVSAVQPDILLVVDFGYYVPTWLLEFPKIAPLNIHPSALPRWRGSSPGQFVLLYGDSESAVTLMKMNRHLDQGPIITQLPFSVQPTWTQQQYYDHSFELMTAQLPQLIHEFTTQPTQVTEQPLESPTPAAVKIDKNDTFIEWDICQAAMRGNSQISIQPQSTLLGQAHQHHHSWPPTLEHACRAFAISPGLWTIVPTHKGERRLKILECIIQSGKLLLQQVQLEGQQPAQWNQVKNIVLEE